MSPVEVVLLLVVVAVVAFVAVQWLFKKDTEAEAAGEVPPTWPVRSAALA